MRSFSCWRATRVRARPLSPPLDAPALHTLHPLPSLNLGHSFLSLRASVPAARAACPGLLAPPLPCECRASGREQPRVPPPGAAPRAAALGMASLLGVRCLTIAVGTCTLGFWSHLLVTTRMTWPSLGFGCFWKPRRFV